MWQSHRGVLESRSFFRRICWSARLLSGSLCPLIAQVNENAITPTGCQWRRGVKRGEAEWSLTRKAATSLSVTQMDGALILSQKESLLLFARAHDCTWLMRTFTSGSLNILLYLYLFTFTWVTGPNTCFIALKNSYSTQTHLQALVLCYCSCNKVHQ